MSVAVNSCFVGDVREGLRAFAAAGIRAQTCVTSPPYWGLRDYGVPGQIGLEPTIGEYVATMVEVFRGVRDVLADDGTLWLNLGDSYHGGGRGGNPDDSPFRKQATNAGSLVARTPLGPGCKPKDLCGIPWRVAFALQADGWYLRSDIIWHKPNPMPESVTDRPTKAHEYFFLLTKRERYYYDADAICEPVSEGTHARLSQNVADQIGSERANGGAKTNGNMKAVARGVNPKALTGSPGAKQNASFSGAVCLPVTKRNKRSVWTVVTESYSEAHFATFPRELIEPCIMAGSRPGDVVIDPFLGSGTTAQVAQDLGRRWIGCELNPDYVRMQAKRTAQTGLALA